MQLTQHHGLAGATHALFAGVPGALQTVARMTYSKVLPQFVKEKKSIGFYIYVATERKLRMRKTGNSQTQDRAENLQLQVSADNKNWKEVWKADNFQHRWEIPLLEKKIKARAYAWTQVPR